jgi:hypothetical protein
MYSTIVACTVSTTVGVLRGCELAFHDEVDRHINFTDEDAHWAKRARIGKSLATDIFLVGFIEATAAFFVQSADPNLE